MGDLPFDPYYEWLGIPAVEQPADFYRLLGISRFEANEKVIERAADRQMGYLRQFQARHPAEAARLLSEVATARITLCCRQKKLRYDHGLGQACSGPEAASRATARAKAEWYVQMFGIAQGPITAEELRRRIKAGELTEDGLVRRGEDGGWMLAREARRLLDLPAPAAETGGWRKPEPRPLPPLDQGPDLLSGPLPEPESRPPYPNAWICPDCRWAVPKRKNYCPRCGYIVRVHNSRSADRYATLIVLAVIGAIAAVLVAAVAFP